MLMINRPFASDIQFGLKLAIFLVVGLVAGGAGTISGAIPERSSTSSSLVRGQWTLDQSGMPPGLKQATQAVFDWLENRQGGDAISGVFFGLGLLALVFPPARRVHRRHAQTARPVRAGHPEPAVARRRRAEAGQQIELEEAAEAPEANLVELTDTPVAGECP